MAYYGPYGGRRYMYERGAVPGAAAGAGALGNQYWLAGAMRVAEMAAEQVLVRLRPTDAAEKRRQEIIGYAKKLIGTCLGCEVFAFGSVPLKTYLPDGDIDITILTNTSLDAAFIDDVHNLLKAEQQNGDPRFQVEEMKFINAEVKLIKCVIGNIILDISFNQVGGVSTLCFLELADSEIGKYHLFKRSIMLIKAWCYNEGHILGAHRWLLSTYALETLVLHIFNIFHKSLRGSLEALYMFLDYYSKFEWDVYGLSLDSPVPLSWLRNSTPTNDELLLGQEPLKGSLCRLPTERDPAFRVKNLNIIDPLKCSNNLGRSVSEESYHHIRRALSFGAQMLGQILLQPPQLISDGIYGFFENTMKRYGGGERQDLVIGPLLQSPDPELSNDVSSSQTSNLNEDEETGADDSVAQLPGKESKVVPAENGNGSIKQCRNDCETGEDSPISTPSMQEQHVLTSSTRTNSLGVSSSCPDNNSSCTDDANQENMVLPFFAPSNLLELSGDLDQHLGYLRHVQYNLEAMFDKFQNKVEEASDAGRLNEEMFRITASNALANANVAPPRTDVPQQSSSDVHQHQLSYGSQVPHNVWSSSPPPVAGAEIRNAPCIYVAEDIPRRTHGVVAYMTNTVVPLSSGIENGAAMSPSPTTYSQGYHDSRFHMTGRRFPKTNGTGIYFSRPRRHRYMQSNDAQSSGQRSTGESARSQTPNWQNTSQQQVSRESQFRARPPMAGKTWKALNNQPRGEDGSSGASSSQPSSLSVPDHGDNTKGNHFSVAATVGSGESSSPAVTAAESSKPVVVAAAGESFKFGADIKPIQEEKLEFGTLGPLSVSPALLTPKFIKDFPPLPTSKRPTTSTLQSSRPANAPASTLQSTKPSPTAAQTRPAESPAPTVQSSKHSLATAQTRPLLLQALTSSSRQQGGVYRLKDEAVFPPLQGGTR